MIYMRTTLLFLFSFVYISLSWSTPSSPLDVVSFSRLKESRPPSIPKSLWCLYVAYPDHIRAVDSDGITWKDGTYMNWETPMQPQLKEKLTSFMSTLDGQRIEPFPSYLHRLNTARLKDQLTQTYPLSFDFPKPLPPQFDPGRVRYLPFFYAMYGSTKKDVGRSLVRFKWPFSNQKIRITTINQVDQRLTAIIHDLNRLSSRFKPYFKKTAGVFYWRMIKGTQRRSMHSFGIAIDVGVHFSNYWKWTRPVNGKIPYRNRFPQEVVEIFEKYGFIWGGKWYHHDTMHFEYRPELSICSRL